MLKLRSRTAVPPVQANCNSECYATQGESEHINDTCHFTLAYPHNSQAYDTTDCRRL